MLMLPLIPKHTNNIAVAFSGGEDSLYAAHILSHKYGKDVTLYHYNHRLLDSDNEICEQAIDAAFQLGLPIRVAVNKDVTYTKGSKEDFCRSLRYNWFKELNVTLVTGHQMSDAIESYVLRCLTGQPEYLPIPVSSKFESTTVIRPFILTPKKDIKDYLDKHSLNHLVVDDPLNTSLAQTRNWLRLSLLPQIKERTNLEKVVKKRYLEYFKKNPLTKNNTVVC